MTQRKIVIGPSKLLTAYSSPTMRLVLHKEVAMFSYLISSGAKLSNRPHQRIYNPCCPVANPKSSGHAEEEFLPHLQ